MFFLNAFNIKLNIKRQHHIYINPSVFNIRFIKIPYVSLYINNGINTFNHFIKVIKKLKDIKR